MIALLLLAALAAPPRDTMVVYATRVAFFGSAGRYLYPGSRDSSGFISNAERSDTSRWESSARLLFGQVGHVALQPRARIGITTRHDWDDGFPEMSAAGTVQLVTTTNGRDYRLVRSWRVTSPEWSAELSARDLSALSDGWRLILRGKWVGSFMAYYRAWMPSGEGSR